MGFRSVAVMTTHDIEAEIARLSRRITELRSLQQGQKHLPFITSHLEEHIQKLEQRIAELRRQAIA